MHALEHLAHTFAHVVGNHRLHTTFLHKASHPCMVSGAAPGVMQGIPADLALLPSKDSAFLHGRNDDRVRTPPRAHLTVLAYWYGDHGGPGGPAYTGPSALARGRRAQALASRPRHRAPSPAFTFASSASCSSKYPSKSSLRGRRFALKRGPYW